MSGRAQKHFIQCVSVFLKKEKSLFLSVSQKQVGKKFYLLLLLFLFLLLLLLLLLLSQQILIQHQEVRRCSKSKISLSLLSPSHFFFLFYSFAKNSLLIVQVHKELNNKIGEEFFLGGGGGGGWKDSPQPTRGGDARWKLSRNMHLAYVSVHV